MTISEFWKSSSHTGPVRRAYREQKRAEAEERQAAFDAAVTHFSADQWVTQDEARRILRSQRRPA